MSSVSEDVKIEEALNLGSMGMGWLDCYCYYQTSYVKKCHIIYPLVHTNIRIKKQMKVSIQQNTK